MREAPDAAKDMIRYYESLRLSKYLCPGGYWTIGWGHVCKPDQQDITRDEGDRLFNLDVDICERSVCACLPARWLGLGDGPYGALISLAYNIGTTNWKASTLRRLLLDHNDVAAADEFPKWRMSGGKILAGLVKRRAAEREMFLS